MTHRYTGLNAHNGQAISDLAHLHQSVTDILTTPRGTRLMRRDYGSDIPDLLDSPMAPGTLQLKIIAAACQALTQWEPRLTVSGVTASLADGRASLTIRGYTHNYQPVTLTTTVSRGNNT
ncbi:baseplate assembly protein W (GpW) [Escherichia coli M056]|uniref:GPW/gp25 family protein n=1 Tax=Escherichia coli TaxID=562 RepID=UPI000A18901F|nr:GPW/gp25 family protein [Escherichia coli]OSK22885.1 baseplate assembly protein W (GpW) [Escherichia coli M056]